MIYFKFLGEGEAKTMDINKQLVKVHGEFDTSLTLDGKVVNTVIHFFLNFKMNKIFSLNRMKSRFRGREWKLDYC